MSDGKAWGEEIIVQSMLLAPFILVSDPGLWEYVYTKIDKDFNPFILFHSLPTPLQLLELSLLKPRDNKIF